MIGDAGCGMAMVGRAPPYATASPARSLQPQLRIGVPAGKALRNISTRLALGFTTTGARAACRREVRAAVGIGDGDFAIAALFQHAHLLFVVAVATCAHRAEAWPHRGAYYRHVLMGHERKNGAGKLGRRAGGDDHAVTAGTVPAQHVQRDGEQALADFILGVARTVQQASKLRRPCRPKCLSTNSR